MPRRKVKNISVVSLRRNQLETAKLVWPQFDGTEGKRTADLQGPKGVTRDAFKERLRTIANRGVLHKDRGKYIRGNSKVQVGGQIFDLEALGEHLVPPPPSPNQVRTSPTTPGVKELLIPSELDVFEETLGKDWLQRLGKDTIAALVREAGRCRIHLSDFIDHLLKGAITFVHKGDPALLKELRTDENRLAKLEEEIEKLEAK